MELLSDKIPASSSSDRIRVAILRELELLNGGGGGGGTLATEATLVSVLNAIVTTQQDVEILLVRDTGNADVVLQQITDYSGGAPVVTYKDVNGNVVVPVGPLEYLDPSAVLNLILTQNTIVANSIAAVVKTPSLQRIVGLNPSNPAVDTVLAGACSVSFFNAGSVNATIQGALLKPGESIGFEAKGQLNTLSAITYLTLDTGDLVISEVR